MRILTSREGAPILAFDIGGTGLKAALIDGEGTMLGERLRIPTPYPCPPPVLVEALVALAAPARGYERIAIGFPGVVRDNRVLTAPHFGDAAWAGFDLAGALSLRLDGRPARMVNDAEMQGLAVIKGRGLELVVTLGTGIGTGLFLHGAVTPHLELAQHPLRRGQTYNGYIGDLRLREIGRKRWRRRVGKAIDTLYRLLYFDHLYIGGGNARHLGARTLAARALPASAISIVSNEAGIEGGAALWRDQAPPEAGKGGRR